MCVCVLCFRISIAVLLFCFLSSSVTVKENKRMNCSEVEFGWRNRRRGKFNIFRILSCFVERCRIATQNILGKSLKEKQQKKTRTAKKEEEENENRQRQNPRNYIMVNAEHNFFSLVLSPCFRCWYAACAVPFILVFISTSRRFFC